MSVKVLVVDDDSQMRAALNEVLTRKGYDVTCVQNGEEVAGVIEKHKFGCVITDVRMEGMGGIEVLRSVKRVDPGLPVLMMTAFGTIENAIEAMKLGAEDYILKPFSPEFIDAALRRVLAPVGEEKDFSIITQSPRMLEIMEIAKGIAATSATVLIMGESGTGKELLARSIHALSDRSKKPFVSVNCASIPEGLLESELFGFEKGAFTGAVSRRVGKFEMAHGGTFLLDEVGEMGMGLQAKLLRVLQLREIDRVGGKEPVSVDIRVIATTNRNLKHEVEEKRFREDLFYRLNVFPLVMPPLRERPEDIELLTTHFLGLFSKRYGKDIKGVSRESMKFLRENPWRGNVRELQNVMERAVLLCTDELVSPENFHYWETPSITQGSFVTSTQDRAAPGGGAGGGAGGGGTLKEMERELIAKALDETNGNKTKAAKILGITTRTLRNKLKEFEQEGAAPGGEEIIAR